MRPENFSWGANHIGFAEPQIENDFNRGPRIDACHKGHKRFRPLAIGKAVPQVAV
jgi:hypothetical protein